MSGITCLSCNVGFEEFELGRIHYKTDWHRYNLKRKVANLPPLTLEKFEERQKAQEQQDSAAVPESCYCKPCNKSFSSSNSYENHLQSKKHKDVILTHGKSKKAKKKRKSGPGNRIYSGSGPQHANSKKDEQDDEEMSCDEDDSDMESMDSYDANILGIEVCLFCSFVSPSMEDSQAHMTAEHGFFLPDAEFICDLEGLISYLGEKVGAGNVCIWCNDTGKKFHSCKDVQRHMMDKGHCKIQHVAETLYEFADFYDYSKSYPDADKESLQTNSADSVDIDELDGDGYSLTLPSGAIIGHRSLARYYSQNLVPSMQEKTKKMLPKMLAQYKALGWEGATVSQVEKRAKDLHFMQRVRNRHFMRLGVKANKFRFRFRDQNT